ncbi:protein lava lamp isoform X2 [Bradysia coprophila]|uniref:protein lava lamp isoform X2 n=1 Tax=Bradysia coprophila TaxID=38358 RepID=UPI00187DD1AD|nr:protein lava lamp isoform X2 [Bradysia coprophila]
MTDADSGSGGGPGPPPDISSLKENFNQQQAKISALKELVRQSEVNQGKNTASAQEKVKNIAQRLSHLKSKATKSRQSGVGRWNTSSDENESILDRAISEKPEGTTIQSDDVIPPAEIARARSETPGSEKIQLLRKQMEQNRLKMAERENSKRGIEELVTQLKAKVDSSKTSLEKTSQLGRSVGDLSVWSTKDRHMSSSDLSSYGMPTTFEKERLKFLERRVRELEIEMKNKENEFLTRNADSEHLMNAKRLESRILDLEEALKEKECVIDARTQAVSLLSENLSLKGKNTVDLLEETKLEMQEMQKKFIEAENGYRVEIERLKSEIDEKSIKIENMDQVNDILETARFDLTVKNSELEEKFDGVQDFSNKLSELNKINHSLQQRIATLESEKKTEESVDELQTAIEKLQIENDALKKMLQHSEDAADETDVSLLDKIRSLENVISSQSEDIDKHLSTIERLENSLQEKTIEYNVLTANFSVLQEKVKSAGPKSLFSMSTDEEAEAEITKLKSQLDEANKSMIKTKLKAKQLQKQLDSVKKSSNSSADVIRLTEENQILQQQVAEMKTSLAADGKSSSSPDTDLEKKIKILETTCQNQVSAILLLEEQKIDMTADLQTTKTELTSLKDHIKGTDDEEHTAMVTSHMDNIEMEEKIDQHLRQNDLLKAEVDRLMEEKLDLSSKLTAYMTENMELLEKLDKISKGSSAESIELIENLTHQEKLEMEEFQKGLHPIVDASEGDTSVMSADLSESLVKLREESSELMHKIEMFTSERREVLDKVEDLKMENSNLVQEVDVLKVEKEKILTDFNALQEELTTVKESLKATEAERAELLGNVKDLSENRSKLQDELNSLIKCRNVTVDDVHQASFSSESSVEVTNDDYEKALKGLEIELENYKKSKDKSVKSKKLAKEAKNVYELLKKLLNDYENGAKQVAELKAEIGRINLQQQEERIKLLLTDEVDKISESKSKEELRLQRGELERVTAAMQDLQLNYEKLQTQLDEKDALLRSADENSTESETLMLRNENDRLKEKVAEIERTLHFDHETIEQKTQELIQLKLEFDNRVDTANKEIDILKKLTAEQKDQLIATLTEHETEINEKVAKIDELELKLQEMSKEVEEAKNQFTASRDEYVEQLQGKVAALKTIFDENNDLLEEQANELRNKQETIESLNGQIMELYKVMEENANKVIEKEDEVNYLQELIDRNEQQVQTLKDKCSTLDNVVRKLEAELQKKSKEIEALSQQQQQSKVVDNSEEIENLKKKYELTVAELESKNKEQLDKLKKFAANLKKKNAQCVELEHKLEQMDRATDEKPIEELTQKLENLQQLLFQKDQELNVMRHESSLVAAAVQQSSSVADTEQIIEELKASNVKEISKLSEEISNLKERLCDAHNQLAELDRQYNSEVANKSAELENLTARMNEKVRAMDELTVNVEKKTAEVTTLQNSLKEFNTQLATTTDDLKSKNVKIEKCRAVIKEKNQTIQKLNSSIAEFKVKLEEHQSEKSDSPLQTQCEHLQDELTNHRETIAGLQNELESLRAQSANIGALEMKNQENEHYIESLRESNQKLNDKIAKLEEGIGNIEERRSSLEQHANLLGSTLQEKTSEFQKNEDELLSRLQALSQHDETIEQRLHEADLEKQELGDRLSELTEERNELVKKLQLIGSQMAQLQGTTLSDLESENATLMEQVKTLQLDLKRQSSEFERKMDEQKSVIADLEYDLSAQLQRLTDERRDLQHNLEKSKDEINELNCDVVRFKEIITSLEQTNSDLENKMTWIKMQNESMNQEHIENQELRMQIVHDQTEIENLKEQTETLQQNHEREVAALRQQILEFDSLRAQIGQNQTDDQVFIQNENERLQGLLATKDLEIQNYQRQNLQLQMSLAAAPNTGDPFINLTQPSAASTPHIDSDELLILTKNVEDLQAKLQTAQAQINALHEQNTELQAQDSLRADIIDTMNKAHGDQLNKLQSECAHRLTEFEEQKKELCHSSEKKDSELKRLQSENEQQKNVAVTQTKVDELQLNVQQLEQYIADLQIQLRISTNDCEQTAQTIQSLEQEIQIRTAKYEGEIASLRGDLERLTVQPPIHEEIAQKAVASTIAAEPQQFLADIERMIIPSVQPTNIPPPSDKPSGLPSFNSSMFFGSPETTAFDDPFTSSQPDSALPADADNRSPVVEPVCVAKKAYLCHPDQIASESEQVVSNLTPVVEEVCVAKKAYLCHPEEEAVTDDGWGFGSDDAVLEEQHQQMSGSITTSSLVPAHIGQTLQDYEDAIKLLQVERDQLQEEKVALQIQSAKMLKKLKEYKSKNEQLSTAASFKKSPSVESNDLDLAIQEELNNQIKLLENRCKEMKAEQEKESSEKQNLLKRVDVLTSANDTMVDLKQRQDNELEMCKSKIRQLSQKISQLEEWSDDNYNKPADDASAPSQPTTSDENVTKQIELLTKQLSDARADFDEIQALLDDEKTHSSILEDRIKKLQESLLARENEVGAHAEMTVRIDKLSAENTFLQNDNVSKSETITQLKGQINESIATIDVLTQEANNIKTYLDQLKEEHRHKIDENNNLSKELGLLSDKNVELSAEVERMKSAGMFTDGSQINSLEIKEMDEKIQELTAIIQYKDAEIGHLNQKVADVIKEDQTQSLVQEILNKNFEINNLRSQVDQLQTAKDDLENNWSMQLTKEIQSQNAVETAERISQLEKVIAEMKTEKGEMEHELQVLNDQVLNSLQLEDKVKSTVLELDMKNIEITELKNSLEQMKHSSVEINPNTNVSDDVVATLNAQWEQVMEQRCSDLAESWRHHVSQREAEFSLTEATLRQEIDLLRQALRQSNSSSEVVENIDYNAGLPAHEVVPSAQQSSDNELIGKMQEALENQEMEIVTLKEQLAIRSAEYARIVSQVDPFGQMSRTSSMMTMDLKAKKSTETLDAPAGQKSELDLALYMLHQRDMRCEELTEELIHLLEERDTLQLKLSNSIRQMEDIRLKTGYVEVPSESESANISPEKPPSNRSSVSLSSDATEVQANSVNLNAKLSQLHHVSHSRDKTLREEREQRQRQMAFLQRDVATLPPEAVAELIGADYTLSRQSQSPSSVLLNWLWGKSTPRPPDTN